MDEKPIKLHTKFYWHRFSTTDVVCAVRVKPALPASWLRLSGSYADMEFDDLLNILVAMRR